MRIKQKCGDKLTSGNLLDRWNCKQNWIQTISTITLSIETESLLSTYNSMY